MSSRTPGLLSAIREQVDTNDLQQELLTTDLSNAFALQDDKRLLRLDSPHPNHPSEFWYWIRYRRETDTLQIGISTETGEMLERVGDYSGELGAISQEISTSTAPREIITGEWDARDNGDLVAEVADKFYWLVAEGHRIFA